jgi:hypothetical protein
VLFGEQRGDLLGVRLEDRLQRSSRALGGAALHAAGVRLLRRTGSHRTVSVSARTRVFRDAFRRIEDFCERFDVVTGFPSMR